MDKMNNIKQGDLFSLLSICSNEELEPLVEYITDAITNHLDTYDIYKTNRPNHDVAAKSQKHFDIFDGR